MFLLVSHEGEKVWGEKRIGNKVDMIGHDTRKLEGWKFPKLGDLEKYQTNRGLNLGMLDEIEVRELVCGVSSE